MASHQSFLNRSRRAWCVLCDQGAVWGQLSWEPRRCGLRPGLWLLPPGACCSRCVIPRPLCPFLKMGCFSAQGSEGGKAKLVQVLGGGRNRLWVRGSEKLLSDRSLSFGQPSAALGPVSWRWVFRGEQLSPRVELGLSWRPGFCRP